MPRSATRVMLAVWLLASWSASGLWAQRVSGTISGYVSDPQNTPVVRAAVMVTNVRTGVVNNTVTDSTGLYIITNLNPGEYTVSVEATGFRRFLQEGVVLRVDSTVRIDPKLQLGTVEQEITVSAAPAMLKAEKTDVSQSISERDLVSLPTPGRNLSKLFDVIPGVVENIFQIGPGENPGGFNGVMVNGQFYGTNEFEIDGISDTACCFSN
jgi:carboxypeptidase family protein